jgi:hypothetical protein
MECKSGTICTWPFSNSNNNSVRVALLQSLAKQDYIRNTVDNIKRGFDFDRAQRDEVAMSQFSLTRLRLN